MVAQRSMTSFFVIDCGSIALDLEVVSHSRRVLLDVGVGEALLKDFSGTPGFGKTSSLCAVDHLQLAFSVTGRDPRNFP